MEGEDEGRSERKGPSPSVRSTVVLPRLACILPPSADEHTSGIHRRDRRDRRTAPHPAAGVGQLEICEIADRVMKQPGGGHGAVVRASRAARTVRAARIRSRSTCSARCGAWRWRSACDVARRARRADHRAAERQGPRGHRSASWPCCRSSSRSRSSRRGWRRWLPGVPGNRLARRGHRPAQAADHHVLARRRRAVHHVADGDLEGSGARHSQRRHVPRAVPRGALARDALAASQGRRGALARDVGAWRGDAGLHRDRRRSRVDLRGERAAPAQQSTSSCSRDSCGANPCGSRRR